MSYLRRTWQSVVGKDVMFEKTIAKSSVTFAGSLGFHFQSVAHTHSTTMVCSVILLPEKLLKCSRGPANFM